MPASTSTGTGTSTSTIRKPTNRGSGGVRDRMAGDDGSFSVDSPLDALLRAVPQVTADASVLAWAQGLLEQGEFASASGKRRDGRRGGSGGGGRGKGKLVSG